MTEILSAEDVLNINQNQLSTTDIVTQMVSHYDYEKNKIENLSEIIHNEFSGVSRYFIEGNTDNRYGVTQSVERLFDKKGAIAYLNSEFWDSMLKKTDLLELMPQKRRDEWFDQINQKKTPDFEEDVVRATMQHLFSERANFFAEKVDGIFRSLSREHVTNQPEGFSKRMILYVKDSYNLTNMTTAGNFHDLRCVIAKFMNREEPKRGTSYDILDKAYRMGTGIWHDIDGNSLSIRVYKKGTAHLEVHPEMAWRLNGVLAHLYPSAIPEKNRKATKQKNKKNIKTLKTPLPSGVLSLLATMREDVELTNDNRRFGGVRQIKNTRRLDSTYNYHEIEIKQTKEVLKSIGGVPRDSRFEAFEFDYEPQEVIDEIVITGCVPDYKSHQFYPTPESIANVVIEAAEIRCDDVLCEPSAGVGNLLKSLPESFNKAQIECFEISPLHCKVLQSKGYENTHNQDFLTVSPLKTYDVTVMNPPFNKNQWFDHVQHAISVTKRCVVVVIPASGVEKLDKSIKHDLTLIGVYDNEFDNTAISTAVVRIDL